MHNLRWLWHGRGVFVIFVLFVRIVLITISFGVARVFLGAAGERRKRDAVAAVVGVGIDRARGRSGWWRFAAPL